MLLNRNVQTRGFAFVTVPDQVRNELLKLNNIQYREKNLIIEAARTKMKTANTIAKSSHSTGPQVVANRFAEHQDLFNGSKLVPTELSYTSAVKSTRLNSGKDNRIIIFGDGMLCGKRFCEFNNEIKVGYAKFKTFPTEDSREILHYVNPPLASCNYDSAVLHLGVNSLSINPTKCSNTLKQFVGNLPTDCLIVSDHFVILALKGLMTYCRKQ